MGKKRNGAGCPSGIDGNREVRSRAFLHRFSRVEKQMEKRSIARKIWVVLKEEAS
jgi:hypothetical protein